MRRIASLLLVTILAYAGMGASCQGNRVDTVIGTTGVAIIDSMTEIRKLTPTRLRRTNVMRVEAYPVNATV